ERSRGVYAVRETIWLDTRGGAKSLAEQRIWVEGVQADNLRQARQVRGADEFAKDRAQLAKHRYGKARRVGALHWRDDREKNVCELVEVFEVIDAARPDETGKRAIFDAPANLVQQSFALPPKTERRAPWAMPYPLEIRHEITV